MVLKWGCELADQMMLPMWLEASDKGHKLYLQNGFEDVEDVTTKAKRWVSHYWMMRRPRKVEVMDAKRLLKH